MQIYFFLFLILHKLQMFWLAFKQIKGKTLDFTLEKQWFSEALSFLWPLSWCF